MTDYQLRYESSGLFATGFYTLKEAMQQRKALREMGIEVTIWRLP